MGINNGIVILDVDDTLIKTQSQQLFIKYLLKKGLLSYLKYFKIMIWFIFYKLGFVSDPQKIAEYSFELFKDKNVSDIEKISKDFFDNNLSKYFYEEALNLLKEHKEKGGNTETDISFQYLKLLFEPDDKKLNKIKEDYESGKLLTGELKQITIEKINSFLKQHQEKREKAKKELDKFIQ